MRVGTICYACEQGIGYLAKWFYDAGVITDVLVVDRAGLEHRRPFRREWFPGAAIASSRDGNLHALITEKGRWLADRVDAMLFVETPFDYSLYGYCREEDVRTVLVPMYEGYPRHPADEPDCFACPSLLDQDIFRERCRKCNSEGLTVSPEFGTVLHCKRHPFVPVPVQRPWQQRTRALRFLHNGGHLGLRGHKGTLELLQAMEFVKAPLDLTVRAQDVAGFERILERVPSARGDTRITFAKGTVPHENLFDGYDVLVQPEKYNGLSLPLQEARAAGLLVVTSNRYPHNTWLPREPLIPVKSYSLQCVASSCLEYKEAELDPREIAATLDRLHGTDIAEYSRGGRAWADTMSWDALRDRWLEVLRG